jgi:hypothetical protein
VRQPRHAGAELALIAGLPFVSPSSATPPHRPEHVDAPLDHDALATTVMERLVDRCGGALPDSAEAAGTLPL